MLPPFPEHKRTPYSSTRPIILDPSVVFHPYGLNLAVQLKRTYNVSVVPAFRSVLLGRIEIHDRDQTAEWPRLLKIPSDMVEKTLDYIGGDERELRNYLDDLFYSPTIARAKWEFSENVDAIESQLQVPSRTVERPVDEILTEAENSAFRRIFVEQLAAGVAFGKYGGVVLCTQQSLPLFVRWVRANWRYQSFKELTEDDLDALEFIDYKRRLTQKSGIWHIVENGVVLGVCSFVCSVPLTMKDLLVAGARPLKFLFWDP